MELSRVAVRPRRNTRLSDDACWLTKATDGGNEVETLFLSLYSPFMSLAASVPEHVRERWRTAVRFADVLHNEAKSRRNPFPARVVTWFNFCRVCQDLEEQMLLEGDGSLEDRQLHRALLSSAIGTGESLLLEEADAEALASMKLSPAAIAAKIDSLRITFDQWHTEIDPERQSAILREVFGGST